MQSRPYDGKDGLKVWLSRGDAEELLRLVETDTPRRLAFQLGLHGLRSEEILKVTESDLRRLEGSERHVLELESAKKDDPRAPPVSTDLARTIQMHASSADIGRHEPLIDNATRTLRDWIAEARERLQQVTGEDVALELGMHDLRRTWATDVFYSLSFAGVPNAEQLTMSWGGWEQTASGQETFRQNYLGPVPDHVTTRSLEHLELV